MRREKRVYFTPVTDRTMTLEGLVPGYEVVPGLVIHRDLKRAGLSNRSAVLKRHGWIISHKESGLRLATTEFRYLNQAIEACNIMERWLPWTRTDEEIRDVATRSRIYDRVRMVIDMVSKGYDRGTILGEVLANLMEGVDK